MQIERYQGTPDRPFPPKPLGFREIDVPFSDDARRARAAGLLGELPPWSFVDEPGPGGVTRYFAFEHPLGRSVGAVFLRRDLSGSADGMLGQTNPNFVPATAAQVQANPPGAALANAAVALLTAFSSGGVPSEHAYSQPVYDFQFAYNDDVVGQVNGSAGFLSEDGGYGPNTQAALSAIAGGTPAPAVNPAPAPSGTTPPTPTPAKPVAQASVTGSSGGGTAAVILGVLVVGGLVTAGLAAKHPIRF